MEPSVNLRALGGSLCVYQPPRARRNANDNSKLTSSRLRRTLRQAPVTPLAFLVIGDCFQQVHPAKLRPQRWCDVNFGIRKLPKKKIAQPHLATGTNHQIRVW